MKLLEFNKNVIFRIDFSIAISHARLFATMFDDKVSRTRREKLRCCYCLLKFQYVMWICSKMIKWLNCWFDSIVVFFTINFCKVNIFFVWNSINFTKFKYDFACCINDSRDRDVDESTIQCILIDFLLVLPNMNFLSFFWFWIALHSCKI